MAKTDLTDLFSTFGKELYESPKPTARDREDFQRAKAEAGKRAPLSSNRLHFKFDRNMNGEELADNLSKALRAHGVDPAQVMIRFFTKDRLPKALETGTDRDETSNTGYNGDADGEDAWMRGLGIWAKSQVTYASPLGRRLSGGADTPKVQNLVYVLYDKRLLYKVAPVSNGFHAFLTSAAHACVAFMSDQGTINLAASAQPPAGKSPPLPFP